MTVVQETYINAVEGTALTVSHESTSDQPRPGLSVLFTTMCIVDLFGVFPIIALPASVIACGIYGIPMVMAVMGLQLYTAVLLGRSWLLAQEITPRIREKNRYPYAAVAELAFGPAGRRVVTIMLNATVFGSGIPNFILAAQSMQIFWWKISGGSVGVTYCVWMLLLALLLCPIMWLGSPKDMKPIATASVCIVTTVAISTWTCIVLDDQSPPSAGTVLDYRPQIADFLIAYGILAFQFDIHPMLLTIQVDMRDSRQINKAVLGGFAVTGLMFTVTTALAANRYGMDVRNNILQGIPSSIPLFIVALLVTLQLCLSSAVSNSVLFQQIEDLLHTPRHFCLQRCLIRSTIVALAVFIAESVPRFDLVMGLIGSSLTGPLMFIFPPIFFLKLCYIKSKMPEKPLKYSNGKDKSHTANGNSGVSNGNVDVSYGNVDVSNGKLDFSNGNSGVSNGNTIHSQNGDLSKVPLIWSDNFRTRYKTFALKLSGVDEEYRIKWYDVMLALIVMTMGIAATVVATYSSWANSIEYASFTPPCLVNATSAARSFLDNQFQDVF